MKRPTQAPPRIAILGTRGYPSYYGGFETAVRHLAPHFCDLGWNVTVYGRSKSVSLDDPTRDRRIQSIQTWGLESSATSTLTHGLSSALDLSVRDADVALIMNVANGFWLPLLRRRGIRTAVNVDGIEWRRAKWGPIARSTFKTGAQLTARYADEIICDAHEIQRIWKKDYGRTGTVIGYGGTTDFKDMELPFELSQKNYILVVARLVPENTIGEFLTIVPKLCKIMPVVIVGSSGYGNDLDRQANKLADEYTNVYAVGHLRKEALLNTLWRHAAVYFHGHSVGGTNPALVQAMASGSPIVALDTPFNRETLGDCGVFTSREPSAILAAIESLTSHRKEAARLSEAASERAATEYSWESVCDAYASLIKRLLDR